MRFICKKKKRGKNIHKRELGAIDGYYNINKYDDVQIADKLNR